MNHQESQLQRQCVAWFRAQYPYLTMLLTHPANEGNGNRVSGAIHKMEGTMAGVADLLIFIPSEYGAIAFLGLCIEVKTENGRQSQGQKDWGRIIVSAGYRYAIVRNFDEFKYIVTDHISHTPESIIKSIINTYKVIEMDKIERERIKLKKLIKK